MKNKRHIEVPAQDYQPTRAELLEDTRIDATPEAVRKRLLEPVEVREISAREWRKRRKRAARS